MRRLILWVLVVAAIAARFTLVAAPDAGGDTTLIGELFDVVKTAHAGHPLQIRPGVTVNKPGYDVGMFLYPSVAITLGGARVPADLTLWQWLQLGFFAIAAGVMLMPGVPLRLGATAAGVLAGATWLSSEDPLLGTFAFHYYGYWAPPLAVLVTLVWLWTLDGEASPARVTVAAALLVGALGEWRVDAAAIPRVAAAALVAFHAVRWIAARCVLSDAAARQAARERSVRVALACLAFLLVVRVPDIAIRNMLALHQRASGVAHFDGTHDKGHMVWHNLYLSYCADALNPYGVDWNDFIGWLHATEVQPGLDTLPGGGMLSGLHDDTLRDLYLRTAYEDPGLWLRALGARAAMLADGVGWPFLELALLALAWAWAASRERISLAAGGLALELRCGSPRSAHVAQVALVVLGAAAIPPLAYNAMPWYSRAIGLAVRALPFLLAAALHEPRNKAVDAGPGADAVDRAVERLVIALAGAGLLAVALFLTAGQVERARTTQLNPPHDLAELSARWRKDPRALRITLRDLTSPAVSKIVEEMTVGHGRVKGGGQVIAFPDEGRIGTVRAVAWVGRHLLVAFRAAATWPANPAVRTQGGWAQFEFQGTAPLTYTLHIPALRAGDEVLWMLPLAPRQEDPACVAVSLREFGVPESETGERVCRILELKRTRGW